MSVSIMADFCSPQSLKLGSIWPPLVEVRSYIVSALSHSSRRGNNIVTWNFKVNCSVRESNWQYNIHSPANEAFNA
jgi:hypothetical protein